MAKETPTKVTFGTPTLSHLSPEPEPNWPKSINMVLSLEEARKLHLGLQHALLEINKLKRSTTAGRRAAVRICLHTGPQRITINPGRTRK